MKTKVLYHGNCPDGFAAAWACWRALGNVAEYIPCHYGSDPPDVAGAHVYIVDFSFKREVMKAIAAEAASITVLDHHKTAQADLVGLDCELGNVHVVFDMNRSGATLAHDFFRDFPELVYDAAPLGDNWLVKYAEDRDLWRHALPLTKEVNAYLQSCPKTFETYNEALAMGPERVAELGRGCLTWMRYYIDSAKRLALLDRMFLGYMVPVVNAPYVGTSEIVGELSEENPQAPFAVGWHVSGSGKTLYSLRSRGGFDVALLAERMGGGGHKNASGFQSTKMPWELSEFAP